MQVSRVRSYVKASKTILSVIKQTIISNGIAVGYYDYPNFGDQLTPNILNYFGLNSFHCPNYRFSTAVCVGSILHNVPDDYKGYILGSGFISDEQRTLPRAKPLLVRGHLTRKALSLDETTLVGDPGLIADKVYSNVIPDEKNWDLGIVPHYRDIGEKSIGELCEAHKNLRVTVIDVRNSPAEVIKKISSCNNILSSSLHGLVIADSIGIPNIWVSFSDKLIGGNFKFNDYYTCFNLVKKPMVITGNELLNDIIAKIEITSPDLIENIKNNIYEAYTEFSRSVASH